MPNAYICRCPSMRIANQGRGKKNTRKKCGLLPMVYSPTKKWDKFSIGKIPTWGGGRFGKRSHFLRVLPFKLKSAQQKSCFKKTYLTHRTLPKANQQRKVSNAAKFSSDEPKSIAGTLVSIDWTSVRHFQHHRTWYVLHHFYCIYTTFRPNWNKFTHSCHSPGSISLEFGPKKKHIFPFLPVDSQRLISL